MQKYWRFEWRPALIAFVTCAIWASIAFERFKSKESILAGASVIGVVSGYISGRRVLQRMHQPPEFSAPPDACDDEAWRRIWQACLVSFSAAVSLLFVPYLGSSGKMVESAFLSYSPTC